MYNELGNSQYRLGSLLLSKGVISREVLDKAIVLQTNNKELRLGQILLENGFLTERQLGKALKQQSWLRKAACIMAFSIAPVQMAAAKDVMTQSIMLPTWDNHFAAEGTGFDAGLPSSDDLADQAMPVYISLDEVRDAYMMVTGRGDEIQSLQQKGWTAPEMKSFRYNVDMFASGGMRVNMRYRF